MNARKLRRRKGFEMEVNKVCAAFILVLTFRPMSKPKRLEKSM